MSEKCCKRMYSPFSIRGIPCSRAGKVEHDGKWYCGAHSPERVAKRKEKQQAKWAERAAADEKKYAAQRHAVTCTDAIRDHLGGKPELVGELVEALRWYAQHVSEAHAEFPEDAEPSRAAAFESMRWDASMVLSDDCGERARAILSRIEPKEQNDG